MAAPAPPLPTSNSSMQHFSFLCPGLHGPGSSTQIDKLTFDSLLSATPTFEIPIMQRRYCWEGVVLEKWWRSACGLDVYAQYEEAGKHRTGILILRKRKDSTILIIDGQQRVTTTLIMCCSIRDALIKWAKSHPAQQSPELLRATELQRVILNQGGIDCPTLFEMVSKLQDGDILPCSRLIPSFPDRSEYFQLLCEDGLKLMSNANSAGAFMAKARRFFNERVENMDGHQLITMAQRTLHNMTVMAMEVTTPELNLCQVFLWLQERSLLSMGALLFNPNPGIRFEAADLTRNLFLANYMNKEQAEQEHVYRTYWLPLERMFSTPATFSVFLDKYASIRMPLGAEASQLEQTVAATGALFKAKNVTSIDVSGALLYTRFLRLYNIVVDPTVDDSVPVRLNGDKLDPIYKISHLALLKEMFAFAKEHSQ